MPIPLYVNIFTKHSRITPENKNYQCIVRNEKCLLGRIGTEKIMISQ
jgi:hypothetical protein